MSTEQFAPNHGYRSMKSARGQRPTYGQKTNQTYIKKKSPRIALLELFSDYTKETFDEKNFVYKLHELINNCETMLLPDFLNAIFLFPYIVYCLFDQTSHLYDKDFDEKFTKKDVKPDSKLPPSHLLVKLRTKMLLEAKIKENELELSHLDKDNTHEIKKKKSRITELREEIGLLEHACDVVSDMAPTDYLITRAIRICITKFRLVASSRCYEGKTVLEELHNSFTSGYITKENFTLMYTLWTDVSPETKDLESTSKSIVNKINPSIVTKTVNEKTSNSAIIVWVINQDPVSFCEAILEQAVMSKLVDKKEITISWDMYELLRMSKIAVPDELKTMLQKMDNMYKTFFVTHAEFIKKNKISSVGEFFNHPETKASDKKVEYPLVQGRVQIYKRIFDMMLTIICAIKSVKLNDSDDFSLYRTTHKLFDVSTVMKLFVSTLVRLVKNHVFNTKEAVVETPRYMNYELYGALIGLCADENDIVEYLHRIDVPVSVKLICITHCKINIKYSSTSESFKETLQTVCEKIQTEKLDGRQMFVLQHAAEIWNLKFPIATNRSSSLAIQSPISTVSKPEPICFGTILIKKLLEYFPSEIPLAQPNEEHIAGLIEKLKTYVKFHSREYIFVCFLFECIEQIHSKTIDDNLKNMRKIIDALFAKELKKINVNDLFHDGISLNNETMQIDISDYPLWGQRFHDALL